MDSYDNGSWEDDRAQQGDVMDVAAPHGPPAGVVFDIVPPPPSRNDIWRSTVYPAALNHSGALRRATIDQQIAARVMPTSWTGGDDPHDNSRIRICGSELLLPVPFEEHCVLAAYERELEKAEQKFRAGRKDKSIGGELGSIVIKRKSSKGKRMKSSSSHDHPPNGSVKRPASNGLIHERPAKIAKETPPPAPKPIDYTLNYRRAIKSSEISKIVKARANHITSQTRLAKGLATACVREARKNAFKSVRVIDDAHRRGRRILRDVLSYWKKEDKERQEERKRLMARAEERRKQEADEREEQRQKNKLKFLLGQSEAFSSFLKAKTKATAEADGLARAQEQKLNTGVKDINGITGAEDEAELKKIAEAKAAQLVAQHKARIQHFDTETQKKKDVAMEASKRAAENRAAARKAMNDIDSIDAASKRELMELRDEVNKEEKQPIQPTSDDDGRLAGAEKPEVAAVRQPTILNCKMKDYQLRGLAWLVSLYDQGINGILADEMGLGKTLQTISFLAYLCEEEDNWGPFLVVSPKATLHNWQQEVTKFCPDLKVLPYWGNKNDRNELRKYWSHKRMYRRDSEFQVCITSYETLTVDEKYFNRVKWQYLVLDEAQAIKNSNSSRWKALLQFPCRNRLLLTGTPLQNKLSELWSLLHFIMPTVFDSHAEFADWFAKDIEGHAQNNKILDAQTLKRLRTLLDPFMLRRVKRDVESEMPPKTELQLPCYLSARQRQLYGSIKANISPEELTGALVSGSSTVTDISDRNSKLMNLVMQLRKVCNHPETFERRVPQSPVQFQQTPPPTQDPLPPSVLMTTNPASLPSEVTLTTRPEISFKAPRCIMELESAMNYRKSLLKDRYGLWVQDKLRKAFYDETQGGLTFLRLCGGWSVSEVHEVMVHDIEPWNANRISRAIDEHLRNVEEMFFGGGKKVHNKAIHDDDPRERIFRILMQPRATYLRRKKQRGVLPGRISAAKALQTNSRMLKALRVYIPPVVAPVPDLYLPGDASRSRKIGVDEHLPYPGMPVRGEQRDSDEVYKIYRSLDAEYGAHIGTAPIKMPEAGRLIADCGKMVVLDPLLRRLKSEGHKCLIYSQFTKVLDILEDYCGKTAFKYVRLDGQSLLADRRDIVAEWQTNEELFIFLLSTRAGGVGLNLTAADTVIFFDSDWNPTQDLQAMDRAHRLGQERPVTVYRLISRGTIEERMLIRAQQKSRINDLVIKGGGLNTEVEAPKDAEIEDIAALLMGEEEFGAKVDAAEVMNIAKRAVQMVHGKTKAEVEAVVATKSEEKLIDGVENRPDEKMNGNAIGMNGKLEGIKEKEIVHDVQMTDTG